MPATIGIIATGLVSAVGLSARACHAAARAGITNPARLGIADAHGKALRGHRLPVEMQAPNAIAERLALAAAMAIDECMASLPIEARQAAPLLLCTAEADRPGQVPTLNGTLLRKTETVLGQRFAAGSNVLAYGRVGAAVALDHARKLLVSTACKHVVIAGADSLLDERALHDFEANGRLLTSRDSDGFMPGEAAAAVLVTLADANTKSLVCRGIGFGIEPASVDSGEALRGDGLSAAMRMAMTAATCAWGDIAARVSDASGEQYFFKESALACARVHGASERELVQIYPAQFIGECGAASGVAALAFAFAFDADAAVNADANTDTDTDTGETNAPGAVLVHLSADSAQRAAMIFSRSKVGITRSNP